MSDTTNARLRQAYTLIENDEHDRAQEILVPLLEDDANNAHLWWVYTHAARDTAIGQAALERVLALDPKYPGARELKADVLEAQSKDPDLVALGASETYTQFTGAGIDVDEWEALPSSAETDPAESSSRGRLALLAVVLIIAAGGAFVISGAVDLEELLSGFLPSPEPQVIVVSDATKAPENADTQSVAESTANQSGALSEGVAATSDEPDANGVDDEELAAGAAATSMPESADRTTVVSSESSADATTDQEDQQPVAEPSPAALGEIYVDPPVVSSEELTAYVSGNRGSHRRF